MIILDSFMNVFLYHAEALLQKIKEISFRYLNCTTRMKPLLFTILYHIHQIIILLNSFDCNLTMK